MPVRDAFRSLVRFEPASAPAWPRAMRAGIALAAPVFLAALLGDPQVGYNAAVGSFTVLYADNMRTAERAKVLPFVALGLIAAASAGAAVGWSRPLTLIGLVIVTVVAAVIVFGVSLGPPGVMFFVLAFGMIGHVAAVRSTADAWNAVAAMAAGAGLSYLIALTPLLLPSRWGGARPLSALLPRSSWDEKSATLLMRTVVVAVVGAAAGIVVDPTRSYWIVATGVAVVGLSLARSTTIVRGVHRMVGTLVGAGVYFVLVLVPWTPVWLALMLGALQFGVEYVIARNYAVALVMITPLVLLLTGAATGELGSGLVAVERVVDTIVGSVLGAATVFLPHVRSRVVRG